MAQPSAAYPLDYSKGPGQSAQDRPGNGADSAAEGAKDAADSAYDIADKVAAQAQEYGEKALEAARNIKPFVEKSLKEQPMATLAVLAVIGFALGALWRK